MCPFFPKGKHMSWPRSVSSWWIRSMAVVASENSTETRDLEEIPRSYSQVGYLQIRLRCLNPKKHLQLDFTKFFRSKISTTNWPMANIFWAPPAVVIWNLRYSGHNDSINLHPYVHWVDGYMMHDIIFLHFFRGVQRNIRRPCLHHFWPHGHFDILVLSSKSMIFSAMRGNYDHQHVHT